tara:strand:+ start:2477 stop:2821 length:345 start_codon:yes stop_codon:yes gene_type:complete
MGIEQVEKPWGYYETLMDEDFTKVKKICIKPTHRPSYQYHFKRSEIWIVVLGSGILTLDDEMREVREGDIIQVPTEAKHRIENTGTKDLIFVEVQMGEYFGEDDIVRIQDDYER